MQNEEFLSVKSVKSAVKCFLLRLAALSVLGIFAANQLNCLSMNNLHTTMGFFRSNPVKAGQG